MTSSRTVADVGEFALIDAIRTHFPVAGDGEIWSGDDAAVIRPSDKATVFTTDVLVENIDFDLGYCPPHSIGYKAIAVNASDVAAMGGRPGRAVATLSLPSATELRVVDEIAQGLAAAGTAMGVDLVGGDLSEAQEISIAVAMIGWIELMPVTRSGATLGDLICVTGELGGAAGGLRVLQAGIPDEIRGVKELVQRQLRPTPRIEEGLTNAEIGATSMIDISDGLFADLGHVLDASGVGCRIEPETVPIDESLNALKGLLPNEEIDLLELAMTGGEDFELLFTISADRLDDLRREYESLGTGLTVIGEVVENGRTVGNRNLEEWDEKGWQHLRNR